MKRFVVQRMCGVWHSLPQAFELMPQTDYQSLISHSAQELSEKAWVITGDQMQNSIRKVQRSLPVDAKRKLAYAR